MSSFLGKVRNLFERKDQRSNAEAGALVRVYDRKLENPNALINRANKRAVGGDVDGAIEDCNAAIQLNPAKATAYFNRGYLHNTVGHYQQAEDDFSEAIQLLPDYDEAYFQRGNSRAGLEDLAGAIADYDQALRINPYNIKVYYQRAELLESQGDQQGALADYSQAILQVQKDANAYHRRGLLLAKMGEPSSAIKDFTQAIDHNPKHADAYFNRGYCYAQLGDEAQAQQDFSQALLFDPTHKAAQYHRSFALGLLKGASSTAVEAPPVLQASVEPPIPMTTGGLSGPPPLTTTLITEAERIPTVDQGPDVPNGEAEEVELTPTVAIEPDSVSGYYQRAQYRAESGNLEGAIADYSAIIEQDPQNSRAYYQRGQSRHELGETDAAISDLEQALHWARSHSLGLLKNFSGELEQTIQTLKSNAGHSPAKTQSLAESIDALSQTIAAHPEDANAYFERGKRRAMLGDLEGAIADYTETIRLEPHHSEAHYKRGRSRSLLGDTQGATDDLNRAIRQPPGSPALSLNSAPSSGAIHTIACKHEGNLPENKFCIHCGATLSVGAAPVTAAPVTAAKAAPTQPELLNGEHWYQKGLALVEAGDQTGGLQALAKALPLFLEQKNMARYQKTMTMMQQLSKDL